MTGRNLLTPLKNGVLKYILFDKLPLVGLCILCLKWKHSYVRITFVLIKSLFPTKSNNNGDSYQNVP